MIDLATGTKQWMTEKEKVGFIGLGNMGGGMAKNLVQKGHDVVAYDVCQDAVCIPLKKGLGEHADKLVQVGTPAEVASQTRVMVVPYFTIKHTCNSVVQNSRCTSYMENST